MAEAFKKIQDVTDLDVKFKQMCLYFTDLLAQEGTRTRPFSLPTLPFFSKLSMEKKVQAIESIGYALEVFEETRAEGFRLNDSPKLIWRSLQKLGWQPPSDVFDKMGESDVIVVYGDRHTNVFQNLRFFDWVSFSLEELYSTPFYQYSRREAWAAEAAYLLASETISGMRPTTFVPDIREHYCEEVGTPELVKFYLHYRCIAPLRRSGRIVGALVVMVLRDWDGVPPEGPLV
jgi:hypothetical protein